MNDISGGATGPVNENRVVGEWDQQSAASEQRDIAYASDTVAVLDKANGIQLTFGHSELTTAHFIAAIATLPAAASRFDKLYLKGRTEVLSSVQARRACFKYLVDVQSAEEARDLLGFKALRDIFAYAGQLATQRVQEHRKVELGDILRIMTETKLAEDIRHLLTGEPLPSLGELAQAIGRVHGALEEHVRCFQNVVCKDDIPVQQIPPAIGFAASTGSRYGDPITLAPSSALPQSTTIRLRDVLGVMEKSREATDSRLWSLEQKTLALGADVKTLGATVAANVQATGLLQAEIAGLRSTCLQAVARATTTLVVSALSLLAAVGLIVLVVGYR
jgi:hypothetical protein